MPIFARGSGQHYLMTSKLKIAPARWPGMLGIALLAMNPSASRADVHFTGLDKMQEANVRALVPLASTSCDTNEWRVERLFRNADSDIRKALQALGYYNTALEIVWSGVPLLIVLGEPVRYRVVDVQFDDESIESSELPLSHLPVAGDILHHGNYEGLKSSLLQHMSDQGYFDSQFSRKEVVVDTESLSADLHLHLNSGPRYRIGAIRFTEGILRDDLLKNYTDISTGDYYDAAEINKLYDSLNGSGYFNSVSIRTDPVDEQELTTPVEVSLTPGIRRNYSVGAGFSTDTGPQGRLGYINRRRNDRGHQFEARLFVSDTDSELTTTYRWPVHDPRTDWASIVGGLQHEDTTTSENDTFKLGYLRTRSIAKNWIWTRYTNYTYEEFSIADQFDSSQLVIFGINFESAIGREISRSTKGRRLNFDLRGASDSLGSDTSFLQFRATARWLWSLTDTTRMIVRGRLGATLKDNLNELPVSVRFFAGGDRSIRGYDYESLGPVDENGLVIGGSHLVEASAEIDRMISAKWSIAAFADTGSAFNDSDMEFSSGVGVGIRWYSPVGPVRLDIAHPLDDPDTDFRLHITLGPDL